MSPVLKNNLYSSAFPHHNSGHWENQYSCELLWYIFMWMKEKKKEKKKKEEDNDNDKDITQGLSGQKTLFFP